MTTRDDELRAGVEALFEAVTYRVTAGEHLIVADLSVLAMLFDQRASLAVAAEECLPLLQLLQHLADNPAPVRATLAAVRAALAKSKGGTT